MPNNKKIVLHILPDTSSSIATVATQIAQSLPEDSYENRAFIIKGKISDINKNHFTRISQIQTQKVKGLKSFFALYNELKLNSPDVVIAHRYKLFIRLLILSKFFPNMKFVSVFHGLRDFESKGRSRLASKFLNGNIALVAVSKAVANYIQANLSNLNPQQLKIINNSLDTQEVEQNLLARNIVRQELELSTDDFVFGAAGRLAKVKACDVTLDAFLEVSKKHINAKLLLIGEGDLRSDIEQFVAEHNLKDKVILTGFKNQAYKYLKGFDVFLIPSRKEGLPLAVLETSIAKIPIISSNIEAFENTVLEKMNRVPVNDSHCLAKRMNEILVMSDSDRQLMVDKQYQYVKTNFELTDMQQSYKALVDSLLA